MAAMCRLIVLFDPIRCESLMEAHILWVGKLIKYDYLVNITSYTSSTYLLLFLIICLIIAAKIVTNTLYMDYTFFPKLLMCAFVLYRYAGEVRLIMHYAGANVSSISIVWNSIHLFCRHPILPPPDLLEWQLCISRHPWVAIE